MVASCSGSRLQETPVHPFDRRLPSTRVLRSREFAENKRKDCQLLKVWSGAEIRGRYLSAAATWKDKLQYFLTETIASRVARATMSAQDTTPGQTFSTADFTASITSYPLTENALPTPSFSARLVWVESRRIEASQPCAHTGVFHCQRSDELDLWKAFQIRKFLLTLIRKMENLLDSICSGTRTIYPYIVSIDRQIIWALQLEIFSLSITPMV